MSTLTNVALLIWGLSEVFLLLKMRSTASDEKGKDKKTLSYLWIVIGFSVFFAIFFSKAYSFPIYDERIMSIAGLIILIMGVIFRMAVIYNLGKYFTVDVTIRKDHQLINTGFYKYIRHPSYTFSLLTFVGLAVLLNNYVSAFILLIPVFWMFFQRIAIEEKALTEKFGAEYIDYTKRTKRLIPFIY